MDPQEMKKFSDLFGRDLSGWVVTRCYFLELDHGLMGIKPAITREKEIIVTLDKALLENVRRHLERQPSKITSLMIIMHQESGVAFNIENHEDVEPLHILSNETIEALCQKEGSIQWAA